MSNMEKNAVVYTHSQNREGIDHQKLLCHEYAKREGYTLIGIYNDWGVPGNTNFSSLHRLIDDSRNKSFQYVIVDKFERLARNSLDVYNLAQELRTNGVKVVSAMENVEIEASTEAIKKAVQC